VAFIRRGRELMRWATVGNGDGMDGIVLWLPNEGEAEVANKGGVKEEGAACQLLAMAWRWVAAW
jgi:hypothetical protein